MNARTLSMTVVALVTTLTVATLAGCGLAETGAAAAAGGVSKTQEVKEGLKAEQRVRDGVADAQAVGRANLEAAEKASE